MRKKSSKKLNIMVALSFVLILLALAIFVLLTFFKLPNLRLLYDKYQTYLTNLELRIAALDRKWIIILSILVLFIIKGFLPLPLLPISCVCVISGMVFNTPISLLINIIGLVLLFSSRYFIGTKRKTLPYKILKNYDDIWKILEHNGNGNPWLLFCCRLIPLFPINTVSNIYGSMRYNFKNYLIISVAGFMPKIVSYLIIGRNAFNPFSASFLIPVMISSLLSGVGLLVTRRIILIINKKGEKNVKN